MGRYDLSNFAPCSGGRALRRGDAALGREKLGVPVIDHWWQTETGWPIFANSMGIEQLPVKPGSPTGRFPAWMCASWSMSRIAR